MNDTIWEIVTRPMLIEGQRPEYCPCTNEEDFPECPVCPATVKGDDIVRGVCQAKKNGTKPVNWIDLIVVPRSIQMM